jgi:hypothetical protein
MGGIICSTSTIHSEINKEIIFEGISMNKVKQGKILKRESLLEKFYSSNPERVNYDIIY